MAFFKSDSSAVDVSAVSPAAANYVDMLEKIIEFCDDSNKSVQSVGSIAAGGTSGYAVGDFLQLDDGAATEAFPAVLSGCRATFEVTAVSTGQVTAVRIINSGCYSTLPTNNGTANQFDTTILSGAGVGIVKLGGVTFDGNGWTINRRTQIAVSATVSAGGTGYVVGNDLTVQGGDTRVGYNTPQTNTPAVFNVDTLSGSAVATVSLVTAGVYHRTPTNPVATTGGAGSGATLTVTYANATSDSIEREVLMTTAAGATVGIRSFTDSSNVRNWEIAAMPAYTAANDFDAQVNISPGRYPDDDAGSYVVLENATFDYWVSVTERRIIGVFNLAAGIYSNMYLGLLNPYATTSEYPNPLLALGCSSVRDITQTTTASNWAGMNGAVRQSSADGDGPGSVYSPGGIWYQVTNGFAVATAVNGDEAKIHVIPGGWFNPQDTALAVENRIVFDTGQKNDWESFASVATATGASGADAPTDTFLPTPGTNDDIPLFECIVGGIEPVNQMFGELDDVCWVSKILDAGSIGAEDTIEDADGDLWIIFNNCRLTDDQHYFAVRVG